jgi:hypothetical protein
MSEVQATTTTAAATTENVRDALDDMNESMVSVREVIKSLQSK